MLWPFKPSLHPSKEKVLSHPMLSDFRLLLLFWKVPSTTGITLSIYSVSQTSLDNRHLTTTCRPYCKVVFAPRYTRYEVHMTMRMHNAAFCFTSWCCPVSCYRAFERINCLFLHDVGRMFLRKVSSHPANTRWRDPRPQYKTFNKFNSFLRTVQGWGKHSLTVLCPKTKMRCALH